MSDDYPYASPPDTQTWQAPWPPPRATRAEPAYVPPLPLLIAGVMLILTGGNALMVPIADSISPSQPGFLAGIAFLVATGGSIGAQASLLTIGAVFATGPLWQRLVWHWASAILAVSAWCLGFAMVEWDRITSGAFDGHEFLTAVLVLPLIALTCQAAPWLLRIYFRWRVQRLPAARGATVSQSPFLEAAEPRMTIRDFLVGAILTGVSLAAIRLGKPYDPRVNDVEYWLAVLYVCAAAAMLVLVVALPILYLLLGLRRWQWGLGGAAAIAAGASAAVAVLLQFLPGGPTGAEKALVAVSLVAGFMVPLAGTLLLARWYGYRFIRA